MVYLKTSLIRCWFINGGVWWWCVCVCVCVYGGGGGGGGGLFYTDSNHEA